VQERDEARALLSQYRGPGSGPGSGQGGGQQGLHGASPRSQYRGSGSGQGGQQGTQQQGLQGASPRSQYRGEGSWQGAQQQGGQQQGPPRVSTAARRLREAPPQVSNPNPPAVSSTVGGESGLRGNPKISIVSSVPPTVSLGPPPVLAPRSLEPDTEGGRRDASPRDALARRREKWPRNRSSSSSTAGGLERAGTDPEYRL